jgi:putative tricarboxylic transport membrane protein
MPPVILGLVLGPVIELNLIRGLMTARGDFWRFFSSPIAAAFLSASALIILNTLYKRFRRKLGLKL